MVTKRRNEGGRKQVTVLGSTGSVGANTVDILARYPQKYEIEALTAYNNVDLLIQQAQALRPKLVVTGSNEHYSKLKDALGSLNIAIESGEGALVGAAARPVDLVMASIVGAAGLKPVMAAIEQGTTIGLANKETLVCAGDVVLRAAKKSGSKFIPVDSEHSAIFQVLWPSHRQSIEKIILTASGGPFRAKSYAEMQRASLKDALRHPNWQMGAKITIDSATMMNKGLELIEAHYLFDMPEARIDILVHPQSIIHSMVSYKDGSVLAQLGSPDMRTPIAVALAYPDRIETPAERLDLAKIGRLSFEAPDERRFPALRLARNALQTGGQAPTILNAANEVAVAAFLREEIAFTQIAQIVEEVLASLPSGRMEGIEDVFAADAQARRLAVEQIRILGKKALFSNV